MNTILPPGPDRPSAQVSTKAGELHLEAQYIALGLLNVIAILSPERMIVGGGVMQEPELLQLVRQKLSELAGGYFDTPELSLPEIENFVVAPALGNLSGVLGAFELARRAADSN